MSKRSFRQILIVAVGLSVSGAAFARNPPALVKQQQAAANAAQTSSGYRDINTRFGTVGARTPEVVRAAGGYRDIHYRFAAIKPAGHSVAGHSVAGHAGASRL